MIAHLQQPPMSYNQKSTVTIPETQFDKHFYLSLAISIFKRPTVPVTIERSVLPPSTSMLIKTESNADSIQTNRLFKIEMLNPFQNR